MLLATAFIWGTAFVAQRKGMEFIGPFTFNGIRSFIGAAVLIPVILFIRNSARGKDPDSPDALISPSSKKNLLKGGLACGVMMFTASSLQQAGMVYTTSGKAGFITALYIVIVPVLGLFIGKRVRPLIVIPDLLKIPPAQALRSASSGVEHSRIRLCPSFWLFAIAL